MTSILGIVIGGALLGGCSATLTPAGQAAKVMKADPPPNCEELGTVSGSADGLSGGDEAARNKMRNEAGEKGANYVRLDLVKGGPNNYVDYVGTAYKCP